MRHLISVFDDFLRALAYLLTAAGGCWLFLYRPPLIETGGPMAVILTLIWAALISTAAPAALATYRRRFGTEYFLIPLFTGALVIALIHGYAVISAESVPRMMFVSALAVLFAARWWTLNRVIKLARGE